LIMVAAQMLTRAMHLDGLADVADALGSYKPPEGAREVLRDPSTGPMGVGSIVLTMLTTTTAFAVIVASVLSHWSAGQMWPGV
ncbi:adenosylcobinamide-GDP ribazoletransferase, partial [Xanthomonas translucens]